MASSRAYALTINNWTEDDYKALENESHDYLIIGKEVGESLTPHLQAYIYKKSKINFAALKKRNPKAHIEPANGSPAQNQAYCSKQKDYKEYGTLPMQGKRNDIKAVKDVLVKTGKISDVIEVATNLQTIRLAETLVKYIEPKRNWKPNVTWIWGPTGAGKTKLAHEMTKDAYLKNTATGMWWDGYDAHEDVIIDDVKDQSRQSYSLLLELLDRYSVRIQVKGGTRQFLAKNIVVTSLHSPSEMFWCFDEACELLRRIDKVISLGNSLNS